VLVVLIIACEVGFWVLLASGLLSRYVLRRRRLSTALLAATPVVDIILFVATLVDLRRGAEPSVIHGLAAAYLWFSIAFGPSTIRWVDDRVAHRFFNGPPPWKPPKNGPARAAYEWREYRRGLVGFAAALVLLGAGVLVIGDWERASGFATWGGQLGVAMVVWLIIGPIWASVAASGSRDTAPEPAPAGDDRGREGDRPGAVRRAGGAARG
jgi:hypothetical protein